MVTVALDAMGGDNAPVEIIKSRNIEDRQGGNSRDDSIGRGV